MKVYDIQAPTPQGPAARDEQAFRIGVEFHEAAIRAGVSVIDPRSVSESDQRRALMMPQELIGMDASRLIILRAGMPPVRGRKIVYWRERAFTKRVEQPPFVPAHPGHGASMPSTTVPPAPAAVGRTSRRTSDEMDDLTLELVLPALEAAGLEPLPPQGATDDEVEAWVDRFIDASVQPQAPELDHGQ